MLKGNEEFAKHYFYRGTDLYKENKIKAAIEEWKKTILIKKDYALAYYNLGVGYTELNNKDEAKKYLQYEPKGDLSGKVKEYLRSIKD